MANINDQFAATAPDLGAIEKGNPMPAYGVRSNTSIVPDVVGTTEVQARSAIGAANLVVGIVTQQSDNSVPAGNVISQTPSAGASVAQGSAVNLVVSSGPANDTLPPATPTNIRVE
ncbi:MAG: PASTA domain-containing protein [Pseudomonadota bacterium]